MGIYGMVVRELGKRIIIYTLRDKMVFVEGR